MRIVCVVAAVAACSSPSRSAQPDVYGPLALCALVLFVVGAGSIAADAFPLRSRLALVCSALTPLAALALGLAGFARRPAAPRGRPAASGHGGADRGAAAQKDVAGLSSGSAPYVTKPASVNRAGQRQVLAG